MVDSNIADSLKSARKKLGLTQQQVADKLYVSRKTISTWETGRNMPDIETITKLSILYKVPVANLVGLKSERPSRHMINVIPSLMVVLFARVAIATTRSMLYFSDVMILLLLLIAIVIKSKKISFRYVSSLVIGVSLLMLISAMLKLFSMGFSLQLLYFMVPVMLMASLLINMKFKVETGSFD
ncbi:helix-turn-helix domain-containing protein [Companilactobacillus mishanensis]|uniref:helix-turn-helix domain-containing protein n=1 Tax=Companilactobacillus mishanensis TaxID=2486008 RepID=UPI0012959EB7|nr:helix-turn-helix transcriptional regulator [Companilactobacillus mishanensis]MQS89660.1 helix-turn-helix transcriptional regulator [Companilactobacillus mishanensis]